MKILLERYKGFLGVLEWKDITSKYLQNKEKEKKNKITTLDSFCKANENSVARKIDILFD
jgi:hypothetical protein